MSRDVAADDDVFGERLGLPTQHVGSHLSEPLILQQPYIPARATREISGLDRSSTVGHRMRGIRNVAVEFAVAIGRWRLETQSAPAVKVEVALGSLARRPLIVRHPPVRARLERQRLGLLEFASVFQVVREERSLNLFAKVLAGCALEINAAKFLAFAAAPAPVVPRADYQIIQMSRVVLFKSLIDSKRPVKI